MVSDLYSHFIVMANDSIAQETLFSEDDDEPENIIDTSGVEDAREDSPKK